MDFNFLDEFKHYPTIELLKIIRQPSQYQPAAVEAAHQLLAGRVPSQAEIEEANQYLEAIELKEKFKRERSDERNAIFNNFFASLLMPDDE